MSSIDNRNRALDSHVGLNVAVVSNVSSIRSDTSSWERQSPDWRGERRQSGDWRSQGLDPGGARTTGEQLFVVTPTCFNSKRGTQSEAKNPKSIQRFKMAGLVSCVSARIVYLRIKSDSTASGEMSGHCRAGSGRTADTGVKTGQKRTGCRGEIEECSWCVAKSDGAAGYDRNRRQNVEIASKMESGKEPGRDETSGTDRNEGGSGREMHPNDVSGVEQVFANCNSLFSQKWCAMRPSHTGQTASGTPLSCGVGPRGPGFTRLRMESL